MTIDAEEALKRLGMSPDVLKPKEDLLYDELVRQCVGSLKIPSIGAVATAAGIGPGSYARVVNRLIKQGRAIRVGIGLYVPIVEEDDDVS